MSLKMSSVLNIETLYNKIKNKTFSAKTNYKMAKLFKAIKEESAYYSAELTKVIEKYGARDETGNFIPAGDNGVQLQQEHIEDAKKLINELLNVDVSLPDIKFSFEELENGDFTVEEFDMLIPFIEE